MFNAVDTFMFCPVIHKGSLDIFQPGDQKHISCKQRQPYKSLRYSDNHLRSSYLSQKTGQSIGKQHKGGYRYHNGKLYIFLSIHQAILVHFYLILLPHTAKIPQLSLNRIVSFDYLPSIFEAYYNFPHLLYPFFIFCPNTKPK